MHERLVIPSPPDFVIPSEARDLQFAARCRSLASLGMTIQNKFRSCTPAETAFIAAS